MAVVIHIDDKNSSSSTDAVLDFVEACVEGGADIDDIIASMLCAVSAILEARALDRMEMQ